MAPKHFDFDDGLGMFSAAQKFVDAHRGALAVADAINNEAWTEHAVSTGEDAGGGGHQGLRIHRDQPAGREFHLIFAREEVEARRLPDRHDDGVALDLALAVVEEGGIEALVLIEDPLRL